MPYDGETAQETRGFLDALLGQVEKEEVEARSEKSKAPSFVGSLFGVQSVSTVNNALVSPRS